MKNMNTVIPFSDLEETGKLEIRELTLQNGLSYPSDEELVMLILGSGTKNMPIDELAKKVIQTVMSSNSDELVENLMKLEGIGKTKALSIAAALEFGKRINRNPQYALQEPTDVIPFIQSYAMQPMEHFLCISINGAKEIISIRVICSGSGNMAIIRPVEVFAEAIKERASAIILSHNHPNGNPLPSRQDIKTTLRLYRAAETIGIALLDHIIIARTSYFSFLEHELLGEDSLLKHLSVDI